MFEESALLSFERSRYQGVPVPRFAWGFIQKDSRDDLVS